MTTYDTRVDLKIITSVMVIVLTVLDSLLF